MVSEPPCMRLSPDAVLHLSLRSDDVDEKIKRKMERLGIAVYIGSADHTRAKCGKTSTGCEWQVCGCSLAKLIAAFIEEQSPGFLDRNVSPRVGSRGAV